MPSRPSPTEEDALPERVGKTLRRLLDSLPPEVQAGPVFVGLSGGRDSLALLHLLRFWSEPWVPGVSSRLHAIHVDHGMHRKSRAQADWVKGVCRSWGIPLALETLREAPRGEASARAARYQVFRSVVHGSGPAVLLLAHHAEDQAETVLFRLLRGTGPRGLAGIPEMRPLGVGEAGAVLRPLLPASGQAIAHWCQRHHLRPREDPTNLDLGFRRNWIRHVLLPRLGPEARDTLLALARTARAREDGVARILAPILQSVVVQKDAAEGVTVDRKRLNLYPLPVRAELLRAILREEGLRISRRGMTMALSFFSSAHGRGELTAAPGVVLVRDGWRGRILSHAGWGRGEGPLPPGETS